MSIQFDLKTRCDSQGPVVLIVNEFFDVFLEELPGMPLTKTLSL
jgi:hypothetical protein